jgi:PTH1 family peptidyl-tRNA hydrolase
MGLFSKDPIQQSSTAPLYTIGGQQVILVVGLGNPGDEYNGTRHNIGFAAVDNFVKNHTEFSPWIIKKDLLCQMTMGSLGGTRVIAMKPSTFMNDSGRAVQAVQSFYKVPSSQTIIVHDELDIPFGQLRTRQGGGTAGHNGLKSIVNLCGDDMGRLRIGIDGEHRTKTQEKDYVLKSFSKAEQAELDKLLAETNAILTEYIYGGQLPSETRSFLI